MLFIKNIILKYEQWGIPVAAYLVKRILSLIPVLFVVTIVIFMIMHLTPGDPASSILGLEASQEEIDALNEQLGLNRPILEQYISWVGGLLRGDLGDSIFMRQPVGQAIAEHIGPTLSLAILAQLIAVILAIPFGMLAAYKRGKLTDYSLMALSLVGMAVPSFLLGMLLMLLIGVELRWLPIAGYKPLSSGLWEHLKFLILPGLSLGTIQAALITRMTRAAMLETMSHNYIKTARSKGLNEFRVMLGHVFRNSLMPVLTVLGQSFGTLVTGAVVVESIFNIPGLGQLIINSIERRDYAVIQGVVLIITIIYVGINLVVDLLYGAVDPRVRLGRR
jgi:peptide/nickel transport system permease protein